MRFTVRMVILALYLSGLSSFRGFAQTPELNPGTVLKENDFMQFITVEAYEVRIELIARCETLVEDMDFKLENASIITPQEQKLLIERATAYFGKHFTFFPQGVPVPPSRSTGNILRLGAIDSVVKERLVEERLSDAVLGIAYSYPLPEIISNFEFSWNSLPGSAERIPVQISTPKGIQEFEFSPFVLTLDWSGAKENFQLPEVEPVPVSEKTWLGRPQLKERSAKRILSRLIENIYTAFEYPTESSIYDNLAKSVAGEELKTIYLDYMNRLEAINRGGPSVEILSVSIEDVSSIRRKNQNFMVDAKWRITGKVRHFGHIHERVNRYKATLTLTTNEAIWQILNIEILEESRLR